MVVGGLEALLRAAVLMNGVAQLAVVPATSRSEAAVTGVATPFMVVDHLAQVRARSPTGAARAGFRLRSRVADRAGWKTFSRSGARLRSLIVAAEVRHRLPEGLLDALIGAESDYSIPAVSRKGAIGPAQLMPATAVMLGVVDPADPWMNIDGGGRYLRRLLDQFGSITLALAAYNAGPDVVRRGRRLPPFPETRRYVEDVFARWRAMLARRISARAARAAR